MGRTLKDLANELEAEVKAIPQQTNDLAIHVATTIVSDLAYSTPVDESTAISNWVVALGAPSRAEVPAHYRGAHGSTYSSSAGQTIADAKKVLASKQPGQAIYISNNTQYIRYLNDGSSAQAPAGFIERAELLGRKMAELGLRN